MHYKHDVLIMHALMLIYFCYKRRAILAKFVVYKSWTRSALLKGTSRCFLVSSITCRSKAAIECFFVVKLSTKPHPLLVLCFHRQ